MAQDWLGFGPTVAYRRLDRGVDHRILLGLVRDRAGFEAFHAAQCITGSVRMGGNKEKRTARFQELFGLRQHPVLPFALLKVCREVCKCWFAEKRTKKSFATYYCERLYQGWETGLEPATPRSTIWCSNQLSYTHHLS